MEKYYLQSLVIVFGVLLFHCGRQVRSDYEEQRYKVGDYVPLYVNKVGPLQNPRETYRYYDLPFCQPDYFKEKKRPLGEALNGDHLIDAPYKLEFRVDKKHEVACRKNLTKEEVSQFRAAIGKDYIFQMFYDHLPVWSSIGRINHQIIGGTVYNKYMLYEHMHFEILFNNDRVVEIYVRKYPEALVEITEDKETSIEFFYTVDWREVSKPFEKRMEKYSLSSFSLHIMEIQWASVTNASIGVLFLIAVFLKIYIRRITKEFKEGSCNEESGSNKEERGLKYMRDDVFAHPGHKSLLAAALGSGAQLLTLTALILILGLFYIFYPHNRGRLLTALVGIYAITSGIAGYTSATFYCHLEGTNWLGNLLLTACLFMGPLLFTFCLLNSLATFYNSSIAVSLGTVMELALIWTLIALPLLVLGGLCGKRTKHSDQVSKDELRAPLNVLKLARKAPPRRWFNCIVPQMAWAGFFPFSAMFCQLPIIIEGVWGLEVFTIYNILSIIFVIAILQTCLLSAIFTGDQLIKEDPKWWWRSFLRGGAVGLLVYSYCIYYYFTRSDWSSVLQISYFFGYMACICFGLFLLFGTVSFTVSFFFVRHIYRSIKYD